MVRSSDIVVSIGFDALDGVVGVEPELIEYLLVDAVFDRHVFLAREQPNWLLVVVLTVPRVLPNLFHSVPLLRVSLQDL